MNLLLDYVNRVAVQSLYSNAQIQAISPCFGETLPISTAKITAITSPNSGSGQIWNPDSLSGWSIRAGIGQIGVQPVAGTFTLTYTASDTTTQTTAPIAYNANAAAIQTALNALSKLASAGGCVVTLSGNSGGFFFVTFNTPSIQVLITGDGADLAPLSLVETGIVVTGSASPAIQAVQTIRILQNPASYAELTTTSPAASIVINELQTGASGPLAVNARYQASFNQAAYGGQWTLTIASIESALLSFNTSAAAMQSALEQINQFSGALIVGQRYVIVTYATGDVFTNVGGVDVQGSVFTATGTTPTTWTHGSVLSPVGVGNVSVAQNSDGSFVIAFQGQMAGVDMGTITGDASSLQVIPYLSGNLSLNTTGMELLLGSASFANALFEIEGTPPGGSPQKLFRCIIVINASLIDPATLIPTPRASFYTASEVDALLATYQPLNSTLTTLSGKSTTGSGAIVLGTSPTLSAPTLGAALASSINGLTLTSSTGVLTITNGKTLSAANSLSFAGTDGTMMTFPGANGTVVTTAAAQTLTNKTLSGVTVTLSGQATGDIYYDGGSGVLTRLGIGSAGQTVTVSGGGLPQWSTLTLPVVAKADLLAQTATVSSVTTFTAQNDGAKHSLTIGAYVSVTAISAGSLTLTITFTDENSASRTITLFPMGLTTAALTATGFTAFASPTIRCAPNTAATLVATFTGVSIAYDVGGFISQVS